MLNRTDLASNSYANFEESDTINFGLLEGLAGHFYFNIRTNDKSIANISKQ